MALAAFLAFLTPVDSIDRACDTTPAIAFLELVKRGYPSDPRPLGFDRNAKGSWSVPELMRFADSSVIQFSDVNGPSAWRVGRASFQRALVEKKGRTYVMLLHLASIYGEPYPQYSSLRFTCASGQLIVELATWYRLTFAVKNKSLFLRRIDYMTHEGE